MNTLRLRLLVAAGVLMMGLTVAEAGKLAGVFRAGAFAMDVTPTNFPVIVNGGFLSQTADKAHDRLHVRWLVLDDGKTRAALGVLDTCLIPREFADAVKVDAEKVTGIPAKRIMLSATHTHSAPSLMRCLGTDADPNYGAFTQPLIVEGLRRALMNLAPARVGWAVAQALNHTHTRVWIRRPDKMLTDPFGEVTVRANMHPGYQNPDVIGPSGPSDPELTLLAVQSPDGRPIAVLANYSMHYFGAAAVSADYYGLFAEKIGPLIGATDSKPGFVGIMSQGTSGDQHWMDYSQPKRDISIGGYADELARVSADAYKTIVFRDWQPLVMREKSLRIATRQPNAKRLAWARDLVQQMNGRAPKSQPEVYAREQLWLKENPVRNVKLQALRVGELGIAIWPCEVFALSGLKIKSQSPLQPTMNIELANGEEGYIPPPELHPLGGYNTWSCRTAGLESNAEPKIVEGLLDLLEAVSGQPRRRVVVNHGEYAQTVLAAKPMAYWRLEEWGGATAFDATGARRHATYEPGVARWLDGPMSSAFSGEGAINHCPHFAGRRMSVALKSLGANYSISLWFWNGLPAEAREKAGVLFARGGEQLGLTGAAATPGRLFFAAADQPLLVGQTELRLKDWHQVVLARAGRTVAVYLDSAARPEISGEAGDAQGRELFFGGSTENVFELEGKLDEVAVFDRALTAADAAQLHRAAGLSTHLAKEAIR